MFQPPNMVNKNRYYARSRISEAKFRQLVKCFALDLTATNTAKLIDWFRPSSNVASSLRADTPVGFAQTMSHPCNIVTYQIYYYLYYG